MVSGQLDFSKDFCGPDWAGEGEKRAEEREKESPRTAAPVARCHMLRESSEPVTISVPSGDMATFRV